MKTMFPILRLAFVAGVVWMMNSACSDGTGGGGAGGQVGPTSSGGAAGSGAGGQSAPGSGGAAGAGGQTVPTSSGIATGGAGGTSTSTGTLSPSSGGAGGSVGTGADASSWPNVGVCAEHAEATVDTTAFVGWEERYIISDSGLGSDADRPCVVRFDIKRVGDAPHASGCMDSLSKKCEWTHLVEYSNPKVMADIDGACAKSDLAMGPDGIAKLTGSRVEVGFSKQVNGAHGSARMIYFEAKQAWDVAGNASWDSSTSKLSYTFRDGFCNYGP
jgi:hypothetical protein